MSVFWWGFLAFPLGLLGLALAALIVFGGWRVTEKWFENRFVRSNPGWHGDPEFGRRGVDETRIRWMATTGLAPKAMSFRVGFGCRIILLHGYQHVGWRPTNRLVTLIGDALEDHDRLELLPDNAAGAGEPAA